jgi:hypothetical protein
MTAYAMFDPTALFAGDKVPRHRVAPISGAAALKRGTLLGRITATDKYIPSVRTASDGSQNPVAVLAGDTDTTAADVNAPAYFEGEFAGEVMVIDASWTIAQVQAALRIALLPLYVRSVGSLG